MAEACARVAVVTGSSRGLGCAIALHLARTGHPVVVNYRERADAAHEVVDWIVQDGGRAIAIQADVSQAAEVERLFAQTTEYFGPVAVLVNNAGIARGGLLVRMTDDAWDTVISTNLRSVYLCTRAALREMINARWGRIINMSSYQGRTGVPGHANYSASKTAIIGLTQAVAREVGSRGITVNAIAPGYIPTDINADASDELKAAVLRDIPLGRAGTPEDVAEAVGFFASDATSYVTGQVLSVDGGMFTC